MENKNLKTYELSYFISPDIKDEDMVAYAQKIKDVIIKEKGDVSKEEIPYKRRLAYPINHKKQGYFGYMHFALNPEKLSNIKSKLSLDKNILRHMFIVVDKKQVAQMNRPTPRPEMQKKIDQSEIEKSVFKHEGVSAQEEKKAEFNELDKKLEEILNK